MASGLKYKASAGRQTVCLAVAIAGVAVLTLSAPRLAAGLDLLLGNAIHDAYYRKRIDRVISEADLERWRQSRLDALGWIDSGTLHSELADIELIAADQGPILESFGHIEAARQSLVDSLRLAPANGRNWLLLALLESQLSQTSKPVVSALYASLVTAPYDHRILGARLNLGFMFWNDTDPALREMLLAQVGNFAPARQLDVLTRIAKRYPERIGDLIAALDLDDAASRQALQQAAATD